MSVVEFPYRAFPAAREWSPEELREIIALFRADPALRGVAWETGMTEYGDPQFYLLDATPDHDCVACVSRLAQGYVLEDGAGRVLGEAPSLDRFAEAAARAAVRKGRSHIARMMAVWITIRLTIEEKLEPILEESEELLVRYAPQVAALV